MRYPVLLIALFLSACATAKEQEARFAALDEEKCKSFGFQPGTLQFADCRLQLDKQRTAARAALLSSSVGSTCSTVGTTTNCVNY